MITAVEFLSPTNKEPGDGSALYTRKQREYRGAGVSQVEVDLTRQGDRSLALPMAQIPPKHRATYLACVRRTWRPRSIEAYPMPIQAPLPTIGVPLDGSHNDVPLELQTLITQCYRNGRYDDIDYRQPVHPPLAEHDSSWVDQLMHAKGLRP